MVERRHRRVRAGFVHKNQTRNEHTSERFLDGRAAHDTDVNRIAIVALARKLAGILFAIWRDGTVYDAARGAAS
jgi:hypothetical protein